MSTFNQKGCQPNSLLYLLFTIYTETRLTSKSLSSVKWTVLAHLKSQLCGQNFQAQKPVDRSSPHQSRINKNIKNAFKTNQILKTSILLNLTQCGLERSTRFGLENFAHEVRI